MVKKIIKGAINVLSVIIIICAIFVLFAVVTTKSGEAPRLFGYSVFKVESGSMEPVIKTDSMIIVKKVKPEQLKVGDVITFYSTDPALAGSPNTHRIVEVNKDANGHFTFVTKGDANAIADKYNTDEAHLIGKLCFNSFFMGKFVSIVSNPIVFIPLILIPLFFIVISSIVRSIKLARRLAKEEEEKTKQEYIEAFNRGKAKAEAELEEKRAEEAVTDNESAEEEQPSV